jgi:hypothetical protein
MSFLFKNLMSNQNLKTSYPIIKNTSCLLLMSLTLKMNVILPYWYRSWGVFNVSEGYYTQYQTSQRYVELQWAVVVLHKLDFP